MPPLSSMQNEPWAINGMSRQRSLNRVLAKQTTMPPLTSSMQNESWNKSSGITRQRSLHRLNSKQLLSTTQDNESSSRVQRTRSLNRIIGAPSCLSPSNKKSVSRPRRCVSFGQFDVIHEIVHIDDIEDDEIDSIWFTPREKKQIARDAKAIVKKVDDGLLDSNDEACRGLEKHATRASKQRKEKVADVYDTVLGMQSFQQRRGLHLPNAMADLCRKQTSQSQRDAYEVALRDAMALLEEL